MTRPGERIQRAGRAPVMLAAALACTVALFEIRAGEIAHIPPHRRHQSGTPMTMINLPVDRRLFELAHGKADDMYRTTHRYYGYFNPERCYLYVASEKRFEPSGPITGDFCNGDWSGNFLNWATMTRLDLARKLLYGGYRQRDLASETVLERAASLTASGPPSRTYRGADLHRLTPLPQNALNASGVLHLCNTHVAGVALLRLGIRNSMQSAQEDCVRKADDPDDLVVRVLACASSSDRREPHEHQCKTYPRGNAKPVGALQLLAESGLQDFGLLMGLHGQGVPSVVLGKNVASFSSEVQASTHGGFGATAGIVSAIDALREGPEPDVPIQVGAFAPTDPLGPLAIESLRYFAGQAPLQAATGVTGAAVAAVWSDPFGADPAERNARSLAYGKPACRPLRILSFDSGVPFLQSELNRQVGDVQWPGVGVQTLTNQILRNERIDIDLAGQGAWLLAGLASQMQQHPVRTDLELPAAAARPFRVETFGVSLGPLPDSPAPRSPLFHATKVGHAAWSDAATSTIPVLNYLELHAGMGGELRDLLDVMAGSGLSAAAASSSLLQPGEKVYVAEYYPQLRGGNLLAYRIGAGGQPAGAPVWQARDTTAQQADQRIILTMDGNGDGVAFRWDEIDDAQRARLNRDGQSGVDDQRGARRLAYLRGARIDEEPLGPQAGNADTGLFRLRPHGLLGAIVNSNPWLMLAPSAGLTESAAPGYAAFRQAHLRRPTMLFVGAEDGMLHGFEADDGGLLMSYVPRALFGRLSRLTAPRGTARPYVDGSPMVADVNLSREAHSQLADASGNVGSPGANAQQGWRSMLFAPLGRGAQAVVALDVTDASFSEDAAATTVRWEFSDADDPDFGNVIARPGIDPINGQPRQVARMANGRWALLLGNGYDSETPDGHAGSGAAALFVLYVSGPSGPDRTWLPGEDYLKIAVGPRGAGPKSGLGAPFPVDTDGDGRIDAIYAGDRKGNVWKFDVSSVRDSEWQLAFGGSATPFYSVASGSGASNAPGITATVIAMPHPLGGTMINFGSGKAIEDGDLPARQVQTLFGLWDRPGAQQAPAGGRGRLLRQTAAIAPGGAGVFSTRYRITNWNERDGWYLELPMPSESLLSDPMHGNGALVSFKTDFKSVVGSEACGSGWDGNLWLLNAFDGSAPERSFDVNRDNRIDAGDLQINDNGALQSLSGLFIVHGSGEVSGLADGQLIRSGSAHASVRRVFESRNAAAMRLYWRELTDRD